jgi:hypothetical protein
LREFDEVPKSGELRELPPQKEFNPDGTDSEESSSVSVYGEMKEEIFYH